MGRAREATAGELFQLFRSGEQLTRSQICASTGLSRGTAIQRLEYLQRVGLIAPTMRAPSTGGRPAGRFAFSPGSLGLIGAQVSPQGTQVGLYDLAGQSISRTSLGPESGIPTINDLLAAGEQLAGGSKRASMRIVGMGLTGNDDDLALVGRLDLGTNTTIRSYSTFEAKAITEVARNNADAAGLLYLHVDEKVSCAFVTNDLVRWTTTDIGHSTVPHATSKECSCGSTSCLLSVADASTIPESEKDKNAVTLRRIGKNLGSSVTALISLLVPDRLVIDSPWNGSEHLLAGLREWVYGRVSAAAGQKITISYPAPFQGEDRDMAAICLIYEILSRQAIDGM